MALRTLTNSENPLINPTGLPWSGVIITFTLVDVATKKPVAAWANNARVTGTIKAKTNANGVFSIDLTPNDQLSPATSYLCESTAIDNQFYAQLESGTEIKQWLDFYSGGLALTHTELSQLQNHIDDSIAHLSAQEHLELTALLSGGGVGGVGSGNYDGGNASSIYGGTLIINGGTAWQ